MLLKTWETETKPAEKKTPVASSYDNKIKRKEKTIQQDDPKRKPVLDTKNHKKIKIELTEVSDEEIQRQVKETLARLTVVGTKSKAQNIEGKKRDTVQQQQCRHIEEQAKQKHILKKLLNF